MNVIGPVNLRASARTRREAGVQKITDSPVVGLGLELGAAVRRRKCVVLGVSAQGTERIAEKLALGVRDIAVPGPVLDEKGRVVGG